MIKTYALLRFLIVGTCMCIARSHEGTASLRGKLIICAIPGKNPERRTRKAGERGEGEGGRRGGAEKGRKGGGIDRQTDRYLDGYDHILETDSVETVRRKGGRRE